MLLYEYELSKAADILARELFQFKPGETFVITADTASDIRVVNAAAGGAVTVGAKPMVVIMETPLGSGKASDPVLPVKALTAALKEADAWVEFNKKFMLYSSPYVDAMRANNKLRYLCLPGMDADMMVRCIGRVNYPVLGQFMERLWKLTTSTKHFRFTTPAGCDMEFDYDPDRVTTLSKGYCNVPGSNMMAGQIGWAPVFDSINGLLVFDGSLEPSEPPLLKEPVRLTIEKAEIVKVEGGEQAKAYEKWLDHFDHPQMRRIAHVCWSCNPGALLTGNILEDERVWGATEWGVGAVGDLFFHDKADMIDAPSHSDGICLNTSAWLDGKQIWDVGKVVDPELAKLAEQLV